MAVVDLVRAGVEQVFALEINFRAAEFARQPFGEIKRRGPAAEFAQVIVEFRLELRVLLRAKIFLLQFLQRMHQGFGHKSSAIRPKWPLASGRFSCATALILRHEISLKVAVWQSLFEVMPRRLRLNAA